MKVIGLCGGSGSGKGAVSKIFAENLIPVIDTDAIYHSITSTPGECLEAISSEFGTGVIKNGALDRPTLAKIVFSSDNSECLRLKLNEITHKFVIAEVERQLSVYEKAGERICVVDVPLLFESGFDKRCDLTVAVVADIETRILRITNRDDIDRESAIARINAQISADVLKKRVDFVIENNSDITDLRLSVLSLIRKINQKLIEV